MTPRESFAVVVRSFGAASILYGLHSIASGVVGVALLEASSRRSRESGGLDAVFGSMTASMSSSVTTPVLQAALVMGVLAAVVGVLLIRWSSCRASFAR